VKEGSTFRGQLKAVARNHIARYLSTDAELSASITPDGPDPDQIKLHVTALREHGRWTEGPEDNQVWKFELRRSLSDHAEQGKATYFTHPSIWACLTAFFFGSSTSLGRLFPKKFGPKIPLPTLALVTTTVGPHLSPFTKSLTNLLQLRNAIDEYRSGKQNNVNFESDQYAPIYSGLMENIKVMMNHTRHGTKLLELREALYADGA
jgi:hypothetical protein